MPAARSPAEHPPRWTRAHARATRRLRRRPDRLRRRVLAVLTAAALAQGFDAGGYLRVMARPDLQGGDGRLGHWNLYGRLMNEGSYAVLDLRYDVLPPAPGAADAATSLHARVEGNALTADGAIRLTRAYALASRLGLPHTTFQFGTLDQVMGDLGLYDMRPASVLAGAVGAAATWQRNRAQIVLGVGDAGLALHGLDYAAVVTAGGTARVGLGRHLELGAGGDVRLEPGVAGNVHSPYQTPGMDYEDWVRGEVVTSFLAENPGLEDFFPDPQRRDATSWAAVAYLGFGDVGPLRWSAAYGRLERRHPQAPTQEPLGDGVVDLYVTDFSDERYGLLVGNEMRLSSHHDDVDLVWGLLYGNDWDQDNDIVPTDFDRTYASSVLRTQVAATPTVSALAEVAVAREWSRNGNRWREHADSIFAGTGGLPDARGLETGDADTRDTVQLKLGPVLQPLGPGVWSRPSLRLLYGAQWSNVNVAFGNAFVETVDQDNAFGNVEIHVHHLVGLEAEAWF